MLERKEILWNNNRVTFFCLCIVTILYHYRNIYKGLRDYSIKLRSISDLDRKILNKLSSKLTSISELASELKENRQFVRGLLESLRSRNLVIKTEVGRATVYQVKK